MVNLVWDHLIINGSLIIFKIGLIILNEAEEKLMQCEKFRKKLIYTYKHFIF